MIPDVPVIIGHLDYFTNSLVANGQAYDYWGIMFGFKAVVPEGLTLDIDNGYVHVNRFGETSAPGVFACGEVTDFWHPCVTTSAAHGIQVAKQISLRLQK
jgi:pyruvate/2-oxoglutarate dehydrogenase complex dihydrolipoamide dehydrogenase (E3) component